MHFRNSLFPATLCLMLAACNTQPSQEPAKGSEPPDQPESEAPTPAPTQSVSILRPDIAPPDADGAEEPLPNLELTIGFPEGGTEIDADAQAALEGLLESRQLALGLPITLRAHSDSAGTDKVNLDASEARGLAVANWLIENGVDEDRITVIAFGEQNPVAPNALDDGTPNEEGRAVNRRVEIEVPSVILPPITGDDAAATESSAEASD